MNTRLRISTLAAVLFTTALATGGVAMAANPHHAGGREHARYTSACSTLSGQWSTALPRAGHFRKLSQARRQERIAERDCRSSKVVELKAGVMHYRAALRTIGVRPSA